jgi:hypothetical protein
MARRPDAKNFHRGGRRGSQRIFATDEHRLFCFLLRVGVKNFLGALGGLAVQLSLLRMHKKSSRRKKKSEDSYTEKFFCAF